MYRTAPFRPRALLIVALAVSLGPQASPALARSTGDELVVVPRPATATGLSYFLVDGHPGRTQPAGSVELVNRSARRMRVMLAAVDGATLNTLGSTYGAPGTARLGASRWLHLERPSVLLAPHARERVSVTVAVPRGAASGDYLGGVSVLAAGQSAGGGARAGASAAITLRYAIGVETVLPGPRHPLIRFTGATLEREPAALTFELDAVNVGNVILRGVHGHVTITRDGRTVLSRPLPAGTFVSGTSIAYPVPAPAEEPAEGTRYGVSAWLRYDGGIARLDTTTVFGRRAAAVQRRYGAAPRHSSAVPWWIAVALALALLYGLLITVVVLRRRARDGAEVHAGAQPPEPPPLTAERDESRERTPAGHL